jgi:methenyltetrahydrofolate cyclohydrolase
VRDETIAGFLDKLAARVPAPGGGAAAAMQASQAAALLAMVGRYSDGPKYADHAPAVSAITHRADELREICFNLIAADIEAFEGVMAASRMPKDTEALQAARSAAMATALAAAAEPPAAVIRASRALGALAADLLPIANRNVITDIGAAAEAVRAAALTARLNIEANLAGINDAPVCGRYRDAIADVDALIAQLDAIFGSVLAELTR